MTVRTENLSTWLAARAEIRASVRREVNENEPNELPTISIEP